MQADYDVIIVGGGLAGGCLAIALQQTGLKIAVVEAVSGVQRAKSGAGDRALALASGTVKMLENLGVWQAAKSKATAIKNIHISDQGHFGKTRLSAQREEVDALGYVIVARDIETHVADLLNQSGIDQICPARVIGLSSGADLAHLSLKHEDESLNLSAKLVVGADGGQSSVRKLLDIPLQVTEYGQTAIVTTVKPEKSHHNTAYERFTSSGPLAMLPLGDSFAVVWTRTHDQANDLLALSETRFCEQLQECFGYRLGELSLQAPRRSFPLTLVRAEKMIANRTVIIGNAVHQLHPVAGQGFNLGLRDVMQLAEMMIEQNQAGKDIGDTVFLETYAQSRQKDHDRVVNFTNSVVHLFSNEWLAIAAARNAGLTLLDHLPFAKAQLARYAMGLNSRISNLGK
jgi:2-octaprenyl-6-methoxyphenol hydroxylase